MNKLTKTEYLVRLSNFFCKKFPLTIDGQAHFNGYQQRIRESRQFDLEIGLHDESDLFNDKFVVARRIGLLNISNDHFILSPLEADCNIVKMSFIFLLVLSCSTSFQMKLKGVKDVIRVELSEIFFLSTFGIKILFIQPALMKNLISTFI